MTEVEIAEISTLLARASSGPWRAVGGSVEHDSRELACCGRNNYQCCGAPETIGEYFHVADSSPDDAAFIAAARSAIPRLLEMVGRQRVNAVPPEIYAEAYKPELYAKAYNDAAGRAVFFLETEGLAKFVVSQATINRAHEIIATIVSEFALNELARERNHKVSQNDTLGDQDRKSFQNPRTDSFKDEAICAPPVHKQPKEQTDLRAALSAARGYLLNAKIDLETGAPKKTAINTIEGGLRLVSEALEKAGVSA